MVFIDITFASFMLLNFVYIPFPSIAFCVLQARDKGRLCWRSKSNYTPNWAKNNQSEGGGAAPSYTVPDSDTETDMYQSFKYRYMTLFPQGATFQHQNTSGMARNV